jgi:hypothetical protein
MIGFRPAIEFKFLIPASLSATPLLPEIVATEEISVVIKLRNHSCVTETYLPLNLHSDGFDGICIDYSTPSHPKFQTDIFVFSTGDYRPSSIVRRGIKATIGRNARRCCLQKLSFLGPMGELDWRPAFWVARRLSFMTTRSIRNAPAT